ncbi:GNAT family N-acetyltransferase [uncultured Bacteroides sp.]|uniref:GNAT family N-acetyltransferase n=1 Tax=uncultured Bacteroides sp. TaxID=162156 RepID=UPI00345C4511
MVYFRKELSKAHVVYRENRDAALISSMVSLWEKSVKASHDFLSEVDIKNLVPVVKIAIKEIENFIILYHGDIPVGFIGIEQRKIEMLFVSPEYFGCGFGKELVDIAIKDYGCIFVDVNEQNPKARDFYYRMGFRQYERTDIDEQGNPFPIIKMKLYE